MSLLPHRVLGAKDWPSRQLDLLLSQISFPEDMLSAAHHVEAHITVNLNLVIECFSYHSHHVN